jgi:hypothetical protein
MRRSLDALPGCTAQAWVLGQWDLDRHLANGTQGRLISWAPEKPDKDKKALLASHPDLTARFVKEASVNKSELVADIDFIDVVCEKRLGAEPLQYQGGN